MTTEQSSNDHLSPEDLYGYLEKSLSRQRRAQVEKHLDDCRDCVSYLATVLRADRAASAEEQETLEALGGSAAEIHERLRDRIAASTPSALRSQGLSWEWGSFLPIAGGLAALVLLLIFVQTQILAPARGRRLASQAMSRLVALRQGTGRIALRYIPGFERARVTRSGFDEADPAEEEIENRLRRAVALAPHDASSRTALGLFLLDQGGLDESQQVLEAALEMDPDSVLAKNGLSVLLFERALQDPDRADALLRRGLSLLLAARRTDPENALVTFNLAMYYQQMGRLSLARQAWTEYLTRHSGTEWAQLALENLEALSRR